jgi:hypothetical protein
MSRSGASGGGGTRKFVAKLRAIGQAVPGTDIEPLCNELIRRIRYIRHKTSEGVYILADSEGYIYVLREQSCFTERAIVQLRRMVVGRYATGPFWCLPSSAMLCADLIRHFSDIGFIDAPAPLQIA